MATRTARTSVGLREALFDAIDKVRAGEMDSDDARAITDLAKQICDVVRLEAHVAKINKDSPDVAAEIAPSFLPLIGSKIEENAQPKVP